MTFYLSSRIRFWAFFIFIMHFSLYADTEEKLYAPMDERNWKIGFQESNSEQSLVEMIPEEEDIMNWKELFTVQKFNDLHLPEGEFASNLEKAFKKHVSEDQLLIFEKFEPKNLNIFESSFIFTGKGVRPKEAVITHDEFNLGRVIKGGNSLYFVRYSTKDPETFKKNKNDWLERLKLMYLAGEPRSNQEGKWLAFGKKEVFEGDKKLTYETNNRSIDNANVGYSISLPKEWLIEEQDIQETDFDETYPYVISLVFSDRHNTIYGGVAFHRKKDPAAKLKKKLRKRYTEIYKTFLPETKVTGKGTIKTVLGQEAIYVSLKEKDDLGWVAFFENGDTIYRVELWGPSDKGETVKADFYKLVTNFQMLKPN
ncbi:MAG: hypothetical protein H0V82_02495 [Candidatus Protochlamydia sp.]|nr:hypothetical protein [Candidatus Protochlamydia sp.]